MHPIEVDSITAQILRLRIRTGYRVGYAVIEVFKKEFGAEPTLAEASALEVEVERVENLALQLKKGNGCRSCLEPRTRTQVKECHRCGLCAGIAYGRGISQEHFTCQTEDLELIKLKEEEEAKRKATDARYRIYIAAAAAESDYRQLIAVDTIRVATASRPSVTPRTNQSVIPSTPTTTTHPKLKGQTKRPRNRCLKCNHQWWPKNKDISDFCPACGGKDVQCLKPT